MPTAIRWCRVTQWLRRTGASRSSCCVIQLPHRLQTAHRRRLTGCGNPRMPYRRRIAPRRRRITRHRRPTRRRERRSDPGNPPVITRPVPRIRHADRGITMHDPRRLRVPAHLRLRQLPRPRAAVSRRWSKHCRSRCGRSPGAAAGRVFMANSMHGRSTRWPGSAKSSKRLL